MATECIQKDFGFHPLKHREIRAQFDGGAITTEGGGLLLREVEKRIGIVRQFAACFRELRKDPLLAVLVEKCDPDREWLAGKSPLNRLELTPVHGQCQGPLQEDRGRPRGGGSAVRRGISGCASASTSTDCSGPGCHRRSAAWEPG